MSLPGALFQNARERPWEPWLFAQRGWDWVWHSWGDVARFAAAWIAPLSRHPAGTRAGFPGLPRPQALGLDLAIQAAGLTSVPCQEEDAGRRGCRLWLAPAGAEPLALPGLGRVDGPALPEPDTVPRRLPPVPESPLAGRSPGGAVVASSGGASQELTQEDLAASAAAIRQALPPGGRREILVSRRPLDDPAERRVLAWALHAGAALVLDPDPATFVATAAWSRPTVFHGDGGEIAALRRAVPAGRSFLRRGPRRPFGRLRALLVSGSAGLPAVEAAFWAGRGVQVIPLAALRLDRGIT